MEINKENLECKALEIADLVAVKNIAYGNSFGDCQIFLETLWPNGVPPESYSDMLTIIRIYDKMKRIATNKHAFDENPWDDIHGYSLLKSTEDQDYDEYDNISELPEDLPDRTSDDKEHLECSCRDNGEAGRKSVQVWLRERANNCAKQEGVSESGESGEDVFERDLYCGGNSPTVDE